jgi:cell wall-associated NlpC family hydrolase
VLQRGDLVYWPGHAGLWIDANQFLHANATDMMVSIAPLATVAAHIKATQGDKIAMIRRP